MNKMTKEVLSLFWKKELNLRILIDFLSKKGSVTVQNIVLDELIKEKKITKEIKEKLLTQLFRLNWFIANIDIKENNPKMIII